MFKYLLKQFFYLFFFFVLINCTNYESEFTFNNSGFYLDNGSRKIFYRYRYYGVDETINGKDYASIPVLLMDGDTLEEIDKATFKRLSDFFVDKNFIYKITSKADYCSVIAEPIKTLKSGCYFENSNYILFSDSLFYNSFDGKDCSGFINILIPKDQVNNFFVLDIPNQNDDYAIFNSILFVNGCVYNSFSDLEIDNNLKTIIKTAINNRNYKIPYCF